MQITGKVFGTTPISWESIILFNKKIGELSVHRQRIWIQRLLKLGKGLDHLTNFIMRQFCGVASPVIQGAFVWSSLFVAKWFCLVRLPSALMDPNRIIWYESISSSFYLLKVWIQQNQRGFKQWLTLV